MIRAKLERSTKNLNIDGVHYCAYCGKEIKPDSEIDHHEQTDYYHCDCPDALKEIEIDRRLAELKKERVMLEEEMPRVKFAIVEKQEICRL